MILDPISSLRTSLSAALRAGGATDLESDKSVDQDVRWAPHLYEGSSQCAWHCLSELPESDRWIARMESAAATVKGLRLGICGPMDVLKEEAMLDVADRLGARLLPMTLTEDGRGFSEEGLYLSAADFIYSANLQLSMRGARLILDRYLERALEEEKSDRKGVLLEVLTAVLLSQVSGYEVHQRDISNRTQQMDVLVHNRNTSGVLRTGEVVLAEAKNWNSPVGTMEYYSVVRKLETKHGRSKLGFFVTTDRFTRGVRLELMRDSKGDSLVVLLDQDLLPAMWRKGKSITANIERAVMDATVG